MPTAEKYWKRKNAELARQQAEEAGGVSSGEKVAANVSSTEGERGTSPGFFVVGPDAWLHEYVSRVKEGLGLPELDDSQKATLERILRDENSLMRMWCEGRLDKWKESALAEKPPILVEGVLPYEGMTLGGDWEIPFNRHVLEDDPKSTRFDLFFFEQLRNRGFDVRTGVSEQSREAFFKQAPLNDRTIFAYTDMVTSGTGIDEFGMPVINDTPEGWGVYEDMFDAFNAVNQGLEETEILGARGLPRRACVDDLLSPTFIYDERTKTVKKKRLMSSIHSHYGVTNLPGMDNVALGVGNPRGETIERDITKCFTMLEEHAFRIGQHKQFGYRESMVCHPFEYEYEQDLDTALQRGTSGALRSSGHFGTMEFRANDTYIETVDPKATMRRFQAQAAYYSGMVWAITQEFNDEYNYGILSEGKGAGLLTGWSADGRGAEDMSEAERRQLAELHFCATLDLFVPGDRVAKTKDGSDFEVRKLVYHEWATSIEPPKPNWLALKVPRLAKLTDML